MVHLPSIHSVLFSLFSHTFCHGKHDAIQILPWDYIARMQYNILDISYVNYTGLYILDFLCSLFDTIQISTKHQNDLHFIMLCILQQIFHKVRITKFQYIEPVILGTQLMPKILVYIFFIQQ